MSFCHHISTVKCPNCDPNYVISGSNRTTVTYSHTAETDTKPSEWNIKIHKAENGWIVWMNSTSVPSVFEETGDLLDFIASALYKDADGKIK